MSCSPGAVAITPSRTRDERRERFEMLAMPHLDAAYNLACWLSRSKTDADDIVQESMLRAFQAFNSLRGADAKPWLLAIVRNCARTHGSRRAKRAFDDLGPDHESLESATSEAPADPEIATIQSDHGRRLRTAIAALPVEFRETLILREMEDLSYREIATITQVPIGTVMSRLARARTLLKQQWFESVQGGRHAV